MIVFDLFPFDAVAEWRKFIYERNYTQRDSEKVPPHIAAETGLGSAAGSASGLTVRLIFLLTPESILCSVQLRT